MITRSSYITKYYKNVLKLFASSENLVNLKSSEELNEMIKNSQVPIIVDFYADWCGPCKKLTPELEKTLDNKKNFKLVKVNVDDFGDLAQEYGVSGIPHVILFKNGIQENSFVGFNQDALKNMIKLL